MVVFGVFVIVGVIVGVAVFVGDKVGVGVGQFADCWVKNPDPAGERQDNAGLLAGLLYTHWAVLPTGDGIFWYK